VVPGIAVFYSNNVLFDDWTFIKIASDEVSGGTDELYTASMSLSVRVGAFKSWKKRMVDVDDLARKFLTKFRA
jgi:hypothetical protein